LYEINAALGVVTVCVAFATTMEVMIGCGQWPGSINILRTVSTQRLRDSERSRSLVRDNFFTRTVLARRSHHVTLAEMVSLPI
jgi:hypothetical protein